MKFNLIKDIWKQNKTNYLISNIFIILGSFFIVLKNKVPLEKMLLIIPLGFFLSLSLLYGISLVVFGGKR